MKELLFEELLYQTYNCLESNTFQEVNNENLELQLFDMRNNIYIESNEAVMKKFESNEPTFRIVWTSFQQSLILARTKNNQKCIGNTNCYKMESFEDLPKIFIIDAVVKMNLQCEEMKHYMNIMTMDF
ncbi:hypothetical protein RFI_30310 [Reticulomyxa filosa]|uniref:Uncharacterized protein n=1 Tax=Reticulomyxa filosa TaxID=46433 RepID=X6LYS4_RETFI|nr:hypothetical protein RFI_30310 [Reticulomyxa filosa]|eukprot:ETO07083.1 hypothetical protein RFI_30310 [Reticulomyxa filosa]